MFRALGLALLTAGLSFGSIFGTPGDYDIFVSGNFTANNSDAQGRVAVGGNAVFSSYNIGSGLAPDGTRLDLVVGGTLNWTNGGLANGSGTYGTAGGSISGVGTPNGTLTQAAPPFNFASAAIALAQLSADLDALGGTVVLPQFGGVNINAASAGLNVFRVSQLSGLTSFNITVAPGATVLINVDAAADSFQFAGMTVDDASKVLFNFAAGTSLSLSGVGFKGSILAPGAALTFSNGNIDGQLFIASWLASDVTGQSHHVPFTGEIPPPGGDDPTVPEPSSMILVGSALTAVVYGMRKARR